MPGCRRFCRGCRRWYSTKPLKSSCAYRGPCSGACGGPCFGQRCGPCCGSHLCACIICTSGIGTCGQPCGRACLPRRCTA